jgi:hypothetical protein
MKAVALVPAVLLLWAATAFSGPAGPLFVPPKPFERPDPDAPKRPPGSYVNPYYDPVAWKPKTDATLYTGLRNKHW